jgi:hypothetical protein
MSNLRAGGETFNAARVSDRLDRRFLGIEKGEQLRNAAKAELKAPTARFLPQETQAGLSSLMQGTGGQNALLGGSNVLRNLPFHVAGVPALGARYLFNRSVGNQAQTLQNAVAVRSPLYQARLAAAQRAMAAQQELAQAQRTAGGILGRATPPGLLAPPQQAPQ